MYSRVEWNPMWEPYQTCILIVYIGIFSINSQYCEGLGIRWSDCEVTVSVYNPDFSSVSGVNVIVGSEELVVRKRRFLTLKDY